MLFKLALWFANSVFCKPWVVKLKGKLNWLQHTLPEGLVVDSGWLERHNVSRQLRRKYVMNGWLLHLGAGRLLPTLAV